MHRLILTELDDADLVRESASRTQTELAEMFGISPKSIRRWIRQLALQGIIVTPKPRKSARRIDDKEFLAAAKKGMTIKELAAHFQVGPVTITNYRLRLGLVKPRKPRRRNAS